MVADRGLQTAPGTEAVKDQIANRAQPPAVWVIRAERQKQSAERSAGVQPATHSEFGHIAQPAASRSLA